MKELLRRCGQGGRRKVREAGLQRRFKRQGMVSHDKADER